jgi:hypothetical protein
MNTKHAQLFVGVSLALLPACGGTDAGSDAESQNPVDDEVAVIEQAIHQSSCWTSTTPHFTLFSHGEIGEYIATSPDANYTRPFCPNQFVVEVEQVLDVPLTVVGRPKHLSLDTPPAYCPGYWAFGMAKGWKNGAWHPIHSWTVTAEVASDGSCRTLGLGTSNFVIPRPHGYSKVRVVVQAGFANSYQQASAGVSVNWF